MRRFINFIYPYVKEHKKPFILINITVIIQAIVQLNIPLYITDIIDIGIANSDRNYVINGFLIILFLAIIEMVLNHLMRLGSVYFSQQTMESIRRDFFTKMQKQEMEFYANNSIGQLMERTVDSVFQMRDILTWGWRITILIIWLSIGTFIAIWNKSLTLSIIFALIYPLIIYILIRSSSKNAKIFYDARKKFGALNEVLAENYSGIRTVKSFGREFDQIDYFDKSNVTYSEAAYKQIRIRAILQPGMTFLIYLGILLLLFVGGVFTQLEIISIGSFIGFMLLVIQISVPGKFLGDLGIVLQMADASAQRLIEVMNTTISIENTPNSNALSNINNFIEFKNVSFTYPSSSMEVLNQIDLHIEHGEKIALLGATGSGKSTLINLLPRLFDPTNGQILIDGVDIRNYTKESLRARIGIVHQDNFLFTMSIHDNIAFGKPDASREDVIQAAKLAQAHKFIEEELPNGYDSIVGERGVTLSGGQRQRITIARALIHDPDLLILDDAVSAVDPETESKLQETLKHVTHKRTTIVISQRPSSLKFVNKIVVIDEGKIVQQGSHSNLMREDGIYRNFINAMENQVKFIDWERESLDRKDELELHKDTIFTKGGSD